MRIYRCSAIKPHLAINFQRIAAAQLANRPEHFEREAIWIEIGMAIAAGLHAALPPFAESSDKARELANPYLMQHGLYADAARAYLASIAYADDMFGRFIKALDASAYGKNTIVVVVSDHGYHLGEKDHWHKATMWERSVRVPFMLAAPSGSQFVPEIDRPVSLLDVYPTLSDLAGLPRPAHALGGKSLVPALKGKEKSRGELILTTLYPGYHSVRDDRYRYIRYPDGASELYDLAADKWEWRDLAGDAQYASVIARLDAVIPGKTAGKAR